MKDIITIARLVVKSLTANIWRTVLTLSGIVISVAAIIVVITLGESVKEYVLREVEAFGTQTIQVEIKVPSTDHMSMSNAAGIAMGVQITTLTSDDARAIQKLPGVAQITEGLMGQEVVSVRGTSTATILMGASSTMPIVDANVKIAKGVFFSERDDRSGARVVVLGSGIAEDLFDGAQAVGETIKIKGQSYRVVGALAERGAVLGFSFDDMIYLPSHTLQNKIMGIDYIQYVTVRVGGDSSVDNVAGDIVALLQMRHDTSGDDDDFGVTTMKEAQETLESVFTSITALLILLAAVSLLVGGVGIMNVMLVAVQERMREIGLRKALGAREKDITRQFLTEAVVISLLGSFVGIVLGVVVVFGAGWMIAQKGLDVPVVITWLAPVIGVGFSAVAGIVFGFVPARRAAQISPIEAIRR